MLIISRHTHMILQKGGWGPFFWRGERKSWPHFLQQLSETRHAVYCHHSLWDRQRPGVDVQIIHHLCTSFMVLRKSTLTPHDIAD